MLCVMQIHHQPLITDLQQVKHEKSQGGLKTCWLVSQQWSGSFVRRGKPLSSSQVICGRRYLKNHFNLLGK